MVHILVVDDDALSGEMTAAVLDAAGHTTTLAENGLDAGHALADHPETKIIVSDMHMPLVSGIDLFRSLREDGVTLPFVLLTGDDPDVLSLEEPGLDACLAKDETLETTLVEAVALLLR